MASAEQLREIGKATRFGPGNQAAKGKRRPLVDRMSELLDAKEAKIVDLWLSDAADEENPMVRRFARNDMLDRLIGKPAQALNVTLDEPEEPDLSF